MFKKSSLAIVLLCALMIPGVVLSDTMEERVAELEARILELEARLEEMTRGGTTSEPPEPKAEFGGMDAPSAYTVVNGAVELGDRLTVTITGYEVKDRFKYYPAGGFSSVTLSAKEGYRLLCLYVTVDNQMDSAFGTSALLDARLVDTSGYTGSARDTFFHLNSQGVYAGGKVSIASRKTEEGCLLFAIPADTEHADTEITVELTYSDTVYTCVLREGNQSVLQTDGEAISF